MHRSATILLFLLVAFMATGAIAKEGEANKALCPAFEEDIALAGKLEWVADIRWIDENSVVIAAQRRGVYRTPLKEASVKASLVIPRGDGAKDIWLPKKLGVSGGLLAVAAPVFVYGWMELSHGNLSEVYFMSAIGDLDLFGNRILLLGAQKDEEERFAPDGAIAWTGRLDQPPKNLKPVLHSSSGSGARSFDACALMEISSARFMTDGSFVLVPGVEPDVYHYDPDGKLLATWLSEKVGFDGECGLSDEEMHRLSIDEPGRWAWVNQRRTVDEILPLPGGPGLLVRTVRGEETSWELALLRDGGEVETCELPFTASSNLAHLKGDVRNGQIVLLLYFHGYTQKTPHPPQHPRILRLRYPP